ncbi:MAG: group III truncated hemoglobin [Beijerinckiaceae bacterium]
MSTPSATSFRQAPAPPLPFDKAGISEADLIRLVHTFYDRIRVDAVLGPIFNSQITDWTPHLAKMVDFWSSIALTSGRYHGRPVPAHVKIPGLERAHFAHWLDLFRATARELFDEANAAAFIDRAERIASSIHYAVETTRAFQDMPPIAAGRWEGPRS